MSARRGAHLSAQRSSSYNIMLLVPCKTVLSGAIIQMAAYLIYTCELELIARIANCFARPASRTLDLRIAHPLEFFSHLFEVQALHGAWQPVQIKGTGSKAARYLNRCQQGAALEGVVAEDSEAGGQLD